MKKNLLLPFILLLLISCREEKIQPGIESIKSEGEIPTNESWNTTVRFTGEDGKIKAVLFANHLKVLEKQRITLLDGVKIDFFNTEQKKTSQLTSLYGKVDDATNNMYASDNVVAMNDSGTVLKTTELMWRSKDEKIVTDKFVRITSPKEIIEGFGMESDQHLDNYTIFNITYSTTAQQKKEK
jgi:LPS export ABC transporter protein LptC